jgi:hypothetical protein
MVDETAKSAILDFMVLRSPVPPDAAVLQRNYINDDYVIVPDRRVGPPRNELPGIFRRSIVAELIYRAVFCSDWTLDDLISELRAGLEPRYAACEGQEQPGAELRVEDLEKHAYYQVDGAYYLMPDTLDSLEPAAFFATLARLLMIFDEAAATPPGDSPPPLDVRALVKSVEAAFGPLPDVVFGPAGTSPLIRDAKRALFDALYLCYVMRRVISVDLAELIRGLQAVHVLEALAVDRLIALVADGHAQPGQVSMLAALGTVVPQLAGWDGKRAPGLPLIASREDLAAYLTATPVIHPLISRLFRYRMPFNTIKPVGVGDLKVVKHWLSAYRSGEIAHIENVLKGERRSRTRRDLDKTEDVLSSSQEDSSQTTRDTQTTDRFELKNESEKIAKNELAVNVGASANFEYTGTGYKIVSSLTAGFAYNTSNTDTAKLSSTFAHDVVDKAVTNVQTRTASSRTTTKIFETEELNDHRFDNSGGPGHISGIYRWVDKLYTAQVYNYGRRLMFEFVLPEPAALFVESRLAGYESSLDVPRYPVKDAVPGLPKWLQDLQPGDIDEARFREYAKQYDLSEFTFPPLTKHVDFIDATTGRNFFSDHGLAKDSFDTRTYMCRLESKDYQITRLTLDGIAFFWGRPGLPGQTSDEPGPQPPTNINTLTIWIDGYKYYEHVDNTTERWYYSPSDIRDFDIGGAPAMADDQVTLTFGFWDGWLFDMSLHATLQLSPEALLTWQQKVYRKIRQVEQATVDQAEQNAEQSFQAELTAYHNRLDELRALAVEDLIQGQSEAFNTNIVLQELKRQCLSMITREMDADSADDTWTDEELVGTRDVQSDYHRFTVDETHAANGTVTTSAHFTLTTASRKLPVPKLDASRRKGRIVQFLEQAFEWPQLSYIPYPYFWSQPGRWYELLGRSDRVDPFFSAFLQAGSVRVLVAVTPAYNHAVLHYIATGEPWEGGPAPAIGDPLYVPIYEELRDQQDDLRNATPDGEPWTFTLPTSLVYLDNSSTPLPQPPQDAP